MHVFQHKQVSSLPQEQCPYPFPVLLSAGLSSAFEGEGVCLQLCVRRNGAVFATAAGVFYQDRDRQGDASKILCDRREREKVAYTLRTLHIWAHL